MRKALVLAGATALGLQIVGAAKPAQACSAEPLLASMCIFAGNFAPRGWALADGQILSIAQNTALFSLLGTTYGGNGQTTFALPDLRGRTPIHAGQGPGLSNYVLGQSGGAEQVTLTVNQIPSHSHTATATLRGNSGQGNTDTPTGAVLAQIPRENIYSTSAPNVDMGAGAVVVSIGNTGGSQPHENRQPFLALNYIIALEGIFPSRS